MRRSQCAFHAARTIAFPFLFLFCRHICLAKKKEDNIQVYDADFPPPLTRQ